jgi:hypothetical protein
MLLVFVALSLLAHGILILDGASSCNVSPAIAGNGAPIFAALPDKDSGDGEAPARVSPGRMPKRRRKARLKALSEL